MDEKIQNEQWYHEIAGELRQYKKYKARIGVLESRMIDRLDLLIIYLPDMVKVVQQ